MTFVEDIKINFTDSDFSRFTIIRSNMNDFAEIGCNFKTRLSSEFQ